MEEKVINNQEEIEIDLQRLFGALLSKAWLIGIVAVVCAVVTYLGTYFFVTPLYQSRAKFYVNNSSLANLNEAALGNSISTADISASRSLVKTYIVILNTRDTLNDVIEYSGVNRSYGELKGMISASVVDSTEVFEVVVTSPNPEEAAEIANAIAHVLPNRIKAAIDGSSAKVVEAAVAARSPSSPNYTSNALKGFLAGLAAMCVLIVLRELVDITVRSEEDIAQSCKYPVLASVPDMETSAKGGYYYGYSRKSVYDKTSPQSAKAAKGAKGSKSAKDTKQVQLVGGNISFAAAEAYKLLRTKLQFSFVDDEQHCRIIGVSSALTGEGKSLSSVNLAYTLSQLGKRVLLVDCDMRRPSLADKLPIRKAPGLSDFLTGQIRADELFQMCGIKNDERAFHAVSSGRTPPNPMELLSSQRMDKMLNHLRESYDYIILDLPPVGEVGDALAVAKLTDGMLIVVRQNYCDRIALNSAIRQFEFVDAKILGVVYNCISESGGYGNQYYRRYYRKYYRKYYGKGYRKYYQRSSGSYASAARKSKNTEK